MADDKVYEGRDLEEALSAASEALGVPEADLHYEIVEQGRRGVFGLGAKGTQIRVTSPRGPSRSVRNDSEARPAAVASPAEPLEPLVAPPGAADVERTLVRIIELMGLDLKVQASPIRGGMGFQLLGPDRKFLTERNAELLWSLQFLLIRMGRRSWPDVGRIQLACEGQPRRRDEDLVERIRRVAQQVARTGRTQKLPPMNAYERRLVHITVREFGGLTSCSEGDGSMKPIRISKVQNLDLGARP